MVDLLVSFYHIDTNEKLIGYFRNNYMDYFDGMKHPSLNPLKLIFLIFKTELRFMRFNLYGLIFSNLNITDYSGEIDSKYQLGGASNKYQPNQFYIMVTDNHTNLLNVGITYQSKSIKEERLNKYIETFNQILINILNNKEAKIKDIL